MSFVDKNVDKYAARAATADVAHRRRVWEAYEDIFEDKIGDEAARRTCGR
jgi:hypothetical protein